MDSKTRVRNKGSMGAGDIVADITPVYRLLPPSEWGKVEHLFQEFGGTPLPHPMLTEIVVAELDNEIVGMLVRQWVPHTEPLWIKEQYRGTVNWMRMLHILEAGIPPTTKYYVFAPDTQIAGMCTAAGMHPTGWRVFEKEVM